MSAIICDMMTRVVDEPAGWAPRVKESIVTEPASEVDLRDVQASLHGDEDAFARLVGRYQHSIFRQMWRFSRDPEVQEELVQQVFIEVFRGLRGFKGRAPFEHWLRRIATRVGYRYWKREARDRRLRDALEQEPLPAESVPEEPSAAAEQLHAILAQLNPKDRLVLTLLYFEECDGAEIASRTGWNPTLVRVRAHRARQRLKALLEESGLGRPKS